MSDHIDLIRIIARDGGRLDSVDQAALAEAANAFEWTQRELLATQAQLIEANAHRIAMNEALLVRKRADTNSKPMSMSSGWVTVPLTGPGWSK